jgi:hypothetical protein
MSPHKNINASKSIPLAALEALTNMANTSALLAMAVWLAL